MKLPDLLPPRDLLDRLGGVAEGLRTHARLGRVPVALGVAAAVVQVLAVLDDKGLIANWSKAVAALRAWASGEAAAPPLDWAIAVLVALLVAAAVVWRAWRTWLIEAETPLRYTFSVGAFEPVDEASRAPHLAWLRQDLATTLAHRIRRLTAMAPEQVGAALASSHFHVAGSLVIRRDPRRPDRRVVEVAPRVRLGAPGAPETIAPAMRYRLPGAAEGQAAELAGPDYARLLERIAYSVASAIYARLREDVARKVEALPVRAHRAAAYLREAEDWARSSTLNGYDDALALLRRAMAEADPRRRPPAPTIWSGIANALARLRADLADAATPALARCLPGIGRRGVLIARVETAFARTVALRELQRSIVSVAAPGREQRATAFAARIEAEAAVARLSALPDAVPGRAEALQDAHAALSLVQARLAAPIAAYKAAVAARDADPVRFETDPMCQYARGDAEASPQARLRLFRRVLQLDPRHKPAQLLFAIETEMRWRQDTALDADAAERIVLPQYERLLDLDGGATAGHANAGYVRWLLAGADERQLGWAIDLFEEGLAAHEIEPASSAAEMHLGLGRALAEKGRLAEAQGHLLEGLAALSGDPIRYENGFRPYLFEGATPALVARFSGARRRVERHARAAPSPLADAVLAMALLDEAEALHALGEATGDPLAHRQAKRAWERAGERSPDNILHAYLGLRHGFPSPEDGERLAAVLEVRAPHWGSAVLLRAERHAKAAYDRRYWAASVRADGRVAHPGWERDAKDERTLSRQLYQGLLPQPWLWPGKNGWPWDAAAVVLWRPESAARRRRWLEEIDQIGAEAIFMIARRALWHAEALRARGLRRLRESGRAPLPGREGWPAGLAGLAKPDRVEAGCRYRQGRMLLELVRLLYRTNLVVEGWLEDKELRQSWNGWRSRAQPAALDTASQLAKWVADARPVHVRRVVRAAGDNGHVLAELLRVRGRIAGVDAELARTCQRLDRWIAAQADLAPDESARLRLDDVIGRLDGAERAPWRAALQLRAAAARCGDLLLAALPDAQALTEEAEADGAALAQWADRLGQLDPDFTPPAAPGGQQAGPAP